MQNDAGVWFWLSAFAAGLLLLVVMPVFVVRRNARPALGRAWLAAVCAVAGLSAVELFSPTAIAWGRALPAVACVAAAYCVLEAAKAGMQSRRAAVVSLAGVAVLGALATVQAGLKLFTLAAPREAIVSKPADPSALPDINDFVEVDGYVAMTDRGTPIPLFVPKPEARQRPLDERLLDKLQGRLIRVAPPDVNTNCNGWTFADGKYLVQGVDVPLILRDNGYEKVTDPQIGDLVVYWIPSGQISHTGVVKAMGEGLVLVESKFGPLGRYLHAPDDQYFGSQFAYYRSPRTGHRLKGI